MSRVFVAWAIAYIVGTKGPDTSQPAARPTPSRSRPETHRYLDQLADGPPEGKGPMKRMLLRICAVLLLLAGLGGAAPSAQASAGVETYYVSHNVAHQDMQTSCHTSGYYSGVKMEYCLHVGVTNEAGSANSYDYPLYATTAWCSNTTGYVQCSSVSLTFRVFSFDGAWHTFYLSCNGNCATGSTHNNTGWQPAGSYMATPRGYSICSTPYNMQSQAVTMHFNSTTVADIATSPWQVCDSG